MLYCHSECVRACMRTRVCVCVCVCVRACVCVCVRARARQCQHHAATCCSHSMVIQGMDEHNVETLMHTLDFVLYIVDPGRIFICMECRHDNADLTIC